MADLLLIDAWTGLRWSELRAIRVRDFIEVPLPVLVVQGAAPEGVRVKVTKSGKSRRVPVLTACCPWSKRSRSAGQLMICYASLRPVISCTRRHSSGRSR